MTLLATRVVAQDLDYGRYESLFGEAVTMSATGKPDRLSDTPVLMDIITADDIQRSGARDIPTLLGRLAGVDVSRTSTSSAEVGIRGYQQPTGSRVMVLINGRQVYFDGFGDVFWSALPVELDEIRQIELIKGPASALYGFNAVDGVINIVTFDPVDDQVNSVRARAGNHARRDLSAITTQSLGDGAGVRLTVADDHADDYGLVPITPKDGEYTHDPNRRSVSFDAGVDLPDGGRLGLEASHTDVTERSIVYDVFYDARVVTDSVKGSCTVNTAYGRVNATAYYSVLDIPWAQTQSLPVFSIDDRSAVAQVSDLFKWGASDSFRLGTETRYDTLTAGSLTNGRLQGTLGAGSAMWEHRFFPALSAVNAVRYDYFQLGRTGSPLPLDLYTNGRFDRSIEGLSVNSSVIDKVTPDDTLRLVFGRGLKLPSLADFGQVEHFVGPQWSPYHYGNPDLLPSAVYDYQAGWDHDFRRIGASGRIALFHQMTMHHMGNAITAVDGDPVMLSAMSAGSVANGVELDLKSTPKRGWRWAANYTFERLHEHADFGFDDAQPAHKVNASLGYGWAAWEADLYASYTSATQGVVTNYAAFPPAPTVERLSSFVTLSPRLAWHATPDLTIELVGESLWPYRDSLAQKMDASGYLSVKLTY